MCPQFPVSDYAPSCEFALAAPDMCTPGLLLVLRSTCGVILGYDMHTMSSAAGTIAFKVLQDHYLTSMLRASSMRTYATLMVAAPSGHEMNDILKVQNSIMYRSIVHRPQNA